MSVVLDENMQATVNDLTFVLNQVQRGKATEDLITDLTHCISRLRYAAPVSGDEAALVRKYREADEARRLAAEAISSFFWPLVKAVTTEEEGHEIVSRIPDGVVKAFAMDYLRYVSKVIPIRKVG